MVKILSIKDSNFEKEFKILLTNRNTLDKKVVKDVSKIIMEVESKGDEALKNFTLKYDNFDIESNGIEINPKDIESAYKKCEAGLRKSLHMAAERIADFHKKQIPEDIEYYDKHKILLGSRWSPLDSVGLYVPGGTAAYPSSVLMLAIPAAVVKIKEIYMCVPCPNGLINPTVLTAAKIAGITKIYKVGGAQAIAAMALGTTLISPVNKIFGPGNSWVSEAKRQLFGRVGVDMIAGPSEIMVIADQKNDPRWIAADLVSQAEHDVFSQSILITDDKNYANKVISNVDSILENIPRSDIARESWENNGLVIIVEVLKQAEKLANDLAPEHLELAIEKPESLSNNITNAGAIFLGRFTPEAIGDYVAGPNHVLPTSRSARFSSGLSTLDYMKRTSIIKCDETSINQLSPIAIKMAESEGLKAHVISLNLRNQEK